MRHRHSGPKVQYRTRRGRIMYRDRPTHSQMDRYKNKTYPYLKRRFNISKYGDDDKDKVPNYQDCRPWDRKRQDDEDLERIDEDIMTLEEQIANIKLRMRKLNQGMNTLSELEERYPNLTEDNQKEINIRADLYADEMDILSRDLDLKANERNRMESERHSLGKPRWFKDIIGEEFESDDT